MIAVFLNPTQIVGWLFIAFSAGILVWLLLTRKPPEEILSELLNCEDNKPVVEGSREPDREDIELWLLPPDRPKNGLKR